MFAWFRRHLDPSVRELLERENQRLELEATYWRQVAESLLNAALSHEGGPGPVFSGRSSGAPGIQSLESTFAAMVSQEFPYGPGNDPGPGRRPTRPGI